MLDQFSYPHDTGHCEVGSSPEPAKIAWDEGKSYPAVNRVELRDVARERAARLILQAFPAKTRRETARRCATFSGYSIDTIENIIEQKSGAPFDLIFAVGALRGVWFVLGVMTGGQSQFHFLSKIAKGVRRVRR